jgi:hypothetical protein
LPESVDCPFLIAPCFVCFRPHVTCVPNVARVSGLSIPDYPFGFFQRLFSFSKRNQGP